MTAVRVANLPEASFRAQMERDNPSIVTALAELSSGTYSNALETGQNGRFLGSD